MSPTHAGDEGLSDYMVALAAVDKGTAGIRGAAKGGASRTDQQTTGASPTTHPCFHPSGNSPS